MLSTGIKLEMAHMWAHGLPNPCRLGSPPCSARGQNQNWPTCGHSRTVAHAVLVVLNASTGITAEMTHMWVPGTSKVFCMRPRCSPKIRTGPQLFRLERDIRSANWWMK